MCYLIGLPGILSSSTSNTQSTSTKHVLELQKDCKTFQHKQNRARRMRIMPLRSKIFSNGIIINKKIKDIKTTQPSSWRKPPDWVYWIIWNFYFPTAAWKNNLHLKISTLIPSIKKKTNIKFHANKPRRAGKAAFTKESPALPTHIIPQLLQNAPHPTLPYTLQSARNKNQEVICVNFLPAAVTSLFTIKELQHVGTGFKLTALVAKYLWKSWTTLVVIMS